jgi:carboxyl-terminal processing protease
MRGFLMALALVAVLGAGAQAPAAQADSKPQAEPLFPVALTHRFPEAGATFEEVRKLILESYYSDEITEEALYWAAIQGMLRHISPPENEHLARIWTPEEYRKVLEGLQGTQVSIGIKSSFNSQEGSLTVNEVLPGSPAESALLPRDRILRINAQPLKGRTVGEINALLEGEDGTEVALTVNRDIEVFTATLLRRRFATENLIAHRMADATALLEIRSFTAGISDRFKAELAKLQEQGVKKLVIDLRNNQGGVFVEPLKMLEACLPEKSILLRTAQRDAKNQNYVSTNAKPGAFEMAVLVNGKTASSAEILAGSLRDHQKAFIVGAKTYGKGIFEKTFTLKNDYRVKFITGVMYTPRGYAWQGKGLLPDFLVEQDEKTIESLLKLDVAERLKKDAALITAVRLLRLRDDRSDP